MLDFASFFESLHLQLEIALIICGVFLNEHQSSVSFRLHQLAFSVHFVINFPLVNKVLHVGLEVLPLAWLAFGFLCTHVGG